MAPMQLPRDFKEFLQLFHANRVEYLLIGGYAVGHYGHPRATGDMDIWISRSPENAEKAAKALVAFGFSPASVSIDLLTQEHQIVRMGVPPMRIDLLTTISGVEFASCYANRKVDVLDDVEVSIISLADLRVNKQASGRLKDLSDLENLP